MDTIAESWPVTIDEVAERWHCGSRWLKEVARRAGCGKRAGKAIILFKDDYEALKESLPCHSNSSSGTALSSGTSEVLSPAAAYKKLRERKTKNAQSNIGQNARPRYGKRAALGNGGR